LVYRKNSFKAEKLKKERQLGVEEHSRQAAEAAEAAKAKAKSDEHTDLSSTRTR
jgi:hypothetical protein